ncbi:MAG: lipase family protein [Mycobacteriaceae bacterium]
MSRFKSITIAVACAIATTVLVTGSAQAEQVIYPAPLPDRFYVDDVSSPSSKPGEVLKARQVPAPAFFLDTDAIQLQYRSTNSAGKPIAAVTTVLSPRSALPGRPLLSYQHIINGLGLECAPSRTLYTSDPNLVIREAPALNAALQMGWSIAIPDHLGPHSSYGAARLGGQITLDGIRAAKNFTALALADSPVAMVGYSGGGMATAMAAGLAASYAPELTLVGSAYGGAPLSIGLMAKGLGENSHPAFGLAMAAALGLEREYPDRLSISAQLNQFGKQLRDKMVNACTNEILAAGAGWKLADVTDITDGYSVLESPSVKAVLAENSVEDYPGIPNAPIYEWHSATDSLIPVDSLTATMRRYCNAGVAVQSEIIWSPDHLTAALGGLPGVLQYLKDRFSGLPAPSNC